MSRKSRYEISSPRAFEWSAGAYIRLSREDESKIEDSRSVTSQKQILQKFFDENPDICLSRFYVDDGYTGTDLDRPSFRTLQEDYENGKINCIVVKDLSRLARNYEEASNLVKVIFPFYKIRFISIGEKIDSFMEPESVHRLDVSFKNIMNDEYSRDLSKKVRSSLEAKRRKGEFVGAFAPFGYQKDPLNYHRLIVDEDAAEIVRMIFKEFVRMPNFSRLAQKLTDEGIPCPMAYKRKNGSNLKNNCALQHIAWNASSVKRILTSEVYLGNLTQQICGVISYKNHKIVKRPKDDWITVKGTHEAIVSEELFDRVRRLIEESHRIKKREETPSLFGRVARCGFCGYPLSVTSYIGKDKYRAYFCSSTYKRRSNCSCKRISEKKMEEAVKYALNAYLKVFLELKDTIAKIKKEQPKQQSVSRTHSDLERKKRELYQNFKNGDMTEESYRAARKKLEQQAESDVSHVEPLRSFDKSIIFQLFSDRRAFRKITREIADKFIEEIKVYSETNIEIVFKFADEFASYFQSVQEHIRA